MFRVTSEKMAAMRSRNREDAHYIKHGGHIRVVSPYPVPESNTANRDRDRDEKSVNEWGTEEAESEGAQQTESHARQEAMHGANRAGAGS